MSKYLLFSSLIFISFCSCNSSFKHNPELSNTPFQLALDSNELLSLSGEKLSVLVCGNCHFYPEPGLLEKEIWAKVFNQMGLRLGIGVSENLMKLYGTKSTEELALLEKGNIYPLTPLIPMKSWEKIKKYYHEKAPDSISNPLGFFDEFDTLHYEAFPIAKPKGLPPFVTMIKQEPHSGDVYYGTASNWLFKYNFQQNTYDSIAVETPPTDIRFTQNNAFHLLNIGIMNPSDLPRGKVHFYGNGFSVDKNELLTNLHRPVNFERADLNNNGLEDIIICEFGFNVGKFTWYEQQEDGSFVEHIISDLPGAIKAFVKDLNNDGSQDIILLRAQGKEGVYAFLNDGEGNFELKPLLKFLPVFGVSHIEMADFNNDGHLDFLLANGDNADYSYSFKNFHGVRIYLNDGNFSFKEAFFQPLYGATMAKPIDFDQDGDLDIAVNCFFPDYEKTPNNNFVFLENKGSLKFHPYTFAESEKGRWLTMEIADLEMDGSPEILLGSFIYAPTPVPKELKKSWVKNGPEVLVLKYKKEKD
ncbi:FG-GAP repeat domain-containing protein [Flexithrix dorotheae]|uniref:FG-GAP repeat domain-containing protein n=1 Tax=Flexithrix dorotheae TaxID=70993 RepID=UPI0003800073|nr:VCBS repeat-containing protein [Flexithrix dorotheae]